jgi:hypothetical protein
MSPRDGEPALDKPLFLRRIGICCLGIVLGGLVGGVVGAGIGQATEPPQSPGDPLNGLGAAVDGFVGMVVGAWAGLLVVAVIGAVLERRMRRANPGYRFRTRKSQRDISCGPEAAAGPSQTRGVTPVRHRDPPDSKEEPPGLASCHGRNELEPEPAGGSQPRRDRRRSRSRGGVDGVRRRDCVRQAARRHGCLGRRVRPHCGLPDTRRFRAVGRIRRCALVRLLQGLAAQVRELTGLVDVLDPAHRTASQARADPGVSRPDPDRERELPQRSPRCGRVRRDPSR